MIRLNNLYLLLYKHWTQDDARFADERQRVQVATGILAAVFFSYRPCSLFNTRIKFDDNNADERLDSKAIAYIRKGRKDPCEDRVDSRYYNPSNSNGNGDSDKKDKDSDSGIDSESSLVCAKSTGSNTDDDYNIGSKETRSFLY